MSTFIGLVAIVIWAWSLVLIVSDEDTTKFDKFIITIGGVLLVLAIIGIILK